MKKEKAKELVDKFKAFANSMCPIHDTDKQPEELELQDYEDFVTKNAIECALIAVDEILTSFNSFMDQRRQFRHELEIDAERYWQQVRQEIENLK